MTPFFSLCLNKILLYTCAMFSVHLLTNIYSGSLGYCERHNNKHGWASNCGVIESFQYMLRVGTAESYRNSVWFCFVLFLSDIHTSFHSSWKWLLTSLPQDPLQHLLSFVFLMIAILTGLGWNWRVFIGISLLTGMLFTF